MFPARAASTQLLQTCLHLAFAFGSPVNETRCWRARGGSALYAKEIPQASGQAVRKKAKRETMKRGPLQCPASKSGLPTFFSLPARSLACPVLAPAVHSSALGDQSAQTAQPLPRDAANDTAACQSVTEMVEKSPPRCKPLFWSELCGQVHTWRLHIWRPVPTTLLAALRQSTLSI